MPLIYYTCECKNNTSKFFRRPSEAPLLTKCEKCGSDMKKSLSAPSSTSRIVVDNGLQARAVEINPNIVEINEERSRKNYKED